jgi:hypothetical protein
VISNLDNIVDAVDGNAGTVVVPGQPTQKE